MVLSHQLRKVINVGCSLAVEPLIFFVFKADVVRDFGRGVLLHNVLIRVLLPFVLNNQFDLLDELIVLVLFWELNNHWVRLNSKHEFNEVDLGGVVCPSDNPFYALQEEDLIWT